MDRSDIPKPGLVSTLDEAAIWLEATTGRATTPSGLIDAGCRGKLRLQVAIPMDALPDLGDVGYGLDPWPITGVLELSVLDALTVQAQRSVVMTSAKSMYGREVRFRRAVTVTADLLRLRRESVMDFASSLQGGDGHADEEPVLKTVEGDNAPSAVCSIFRNMLNLNPREVSIDFAAGGSGRVILNISARGEARRVVPAELELIDRRGGHMNSQGCRRAFNSTQRCALNFTQGL
jgi:hypothetical protein